MSEGAKGRLSRVGARMGIRWKRRRVGILSWHVRGYRQEEIRVQASGERIYRASECRYGVSRYLPIPTRGLAQFGGILRFGLVGEPASIVHEKVERLQES